MLNEIIQLCYRLGIIHVGATDTGEYIPSIRVINYVKETSPNHQLATIAHELGHSLQTSEEFEYFESHTIQGKHQFILAIEEDAWDKGESILRIRFPELDEAFWVDFEAFKIHCLGTYKSLPRISIINHFKFYKKFLIDHSKTLEPINLEFLTTIGLEVQEKGLSLHHEK